MIHARHQRGAAAVALLSLAVGSSAWALDGTEALRVTPQNGYLAFEIVTQSDDISGVADAGYGATLTRGTFDGLGAWNVGSTLRIVANHEQSAAAISRIDVDLAAFQQAIASTIGGGSPTFPSSFVTGIGYAYSNIYDNTYDAISNPTPAASGTAAVAAYGDANFSRFCSGTAYVAGAFGGGRGFADGIYMTGEEVSGGQFYALDTATGDLWQVDAFGAGNWENAAEVDTGNTSHVAMVLNSDVGSAPGDYIRLYVGTKGVDANGDGTVDFLERNGLRGGTVYYFDPDGGASTTDLPDGVVSGAWNVSNANALRETKLEDIATSPFDGTTLAFGASNDGVYRMDLTMAFSGGSLDTAGSPVTITQLRDDDIDAPNDINEPDNLAWSLDGYLYIEEDGSGNDVWRMTADGSSIFKIATGLGEPSGIIDVSGLVGYAPGSVFLTSIQGTPTQLAVLISPTAQAVPTPTALGAGLALIACVASRRRRLGQ